jgi:altronate dehydratase small subunit
MQGHMSASASAFQIHATDNVATLLADAADSTEVRITGEGRGAAVTAANPIRSGHKIALRPIAEGAAIVKYGFPIGRAAQPISAGEWVHLHNCASNFDAKSSSLDLESGARPETRYA